MRNLLLMILSVLMVSCGDSRTSDEYLQQARQYHADARNKAAVIELKNALRKDPANGEARFLLGEVYLDLGDVEYAEKELLKARELGWSDSEVLPSLARAWLAMSEFAEVASLEHEHLESGAAIRLIASKVKAWLALGKLDEAQSLVTVALRKAPNSAEVKLSSALVSASLEDWDRAEAVLSELLESDPPNSDALRVKGDMALKRNHLETARDAYSLYISLNEQSLPEMAKRAWVNLLLGEYGATEKDTREILERAPNNSFGQFLQGLLYFKDKKYQQSINALSLAEPASREFPFIHYYLASAHMLEGSVDQAAQFAGQFVAQVPEDVEGRKLLATLRLQLGNVDEARKLLQPVLDNNPDDVIALHIMASILIKEGRADEGVELLERIARLEPGSSVAQLRLGTVLMQHGRAEEASRHLEAVADINPEFQQADILLIMNLLQKREFDRAVEVAEKYRIRNLADTAANIVLGRVYLAAGRGDDAINVFNQLLEVEPNNAAARLMLARVAKQDGDRESARQHYLKVLDTDPDNLQAMMQLVDIEKALKNTREMLKWLERAVVRHPGALQPRLALANYYLESGQESQVLALFASLTDLQRGSRPVLDMLAKARMAGNQYGNASRTLEQLIDTNPEVAHYQYMLAITSAKAGYLDRYEKALARAHEIDDKHIPTLIALARLSLEKKSLADFVRYVAALSELEPNQESVLRLRAVKAKLDGNFLESSRLAAKAFEKNPTSKLLLELVSSQRLAGQVDQSVQLMKQWLSTHPEDVAVRIALANALQGSDQLEVAEDQYLKVLQLDAENVVALNNLAWMLRKKDLKISLEYIRKAVVLAPESADLLDTLAYIEYLNGSYKAAYEGIQKAIQIAPDNATFQYRKALILAASGKTTQAEEVLARVVADSNFPEIQDAKDLLSELRSGRH